MINFSSRLLSNPLTMLLSGREVIRPQIVSQRFFSILSILQKSITENMQQHNGLKSCDKHNENNEDNERLKIFKKLRKDTAIDSMNKKLFAVIHVAGSQFKVTNNDVIMIHKKIEAECGDRIRLEKVLAVGGRNFTFVGQPLLKRDLVNIQATVMEKTKGEKVIAFKKKKRKGYKRWKGHRQDLSVIKINSIDVETSAL